MVSVGCIQTLLTCAKAQERHAMLLEGFSIGYIQLGTRLGQRRYNTLMDLHGTLCHV